MRLIIPRTTLMITCVCLSHSNYVTSDGQDYTGGNYSVIFPAGSTKESVSIPITDDDIFETDETFSLTLVIPQPAQDIGVMRGDPFMATVTIIDDDGECSVISFPHTDTFGAASYLQSPLGPRAVSTTFTFASWFSAQVYCGSPACSNCANCNSILFELCLRISCCIATVLR